MTQGTRGRKQMRRTREWSAWGLGQVLREAGGGASEQEQASPSPGGEELGGHEPDMQGSLSVHTKSSTPIKVISRSQEKGGQVSQCMFVGTNTHITYACTHADMHRAHILTHTYICNIDMCRAHAH